MLIVLVLGLLLIPMPALARNTAYVSGYKSPSPEQREEIEQVEQTPSISAISPEEAQINSGAKTITITGSGFNPSSTAKVNSSNRYTTFIDDSHLLVEINSYDMSRSDGGFYITVWNSNGEYSNAALFTLNGKAAASTSSNNNNSAPASNNYQDNTSYSNGYNNTAPVNYSPGTIESVNEDEDQSLASSVILGGSTFLPTGIVQWVLVAILIVLIIVIGRKVLGNREEYDNTPLKHA